MTQNVAQLRSNDPTKQVDLLDELLRIRQLIASLQAEEKALRDILLADPSARVCADYIAAVKQGVTYRVRGKHPQE